MREKLKYNAIMASLSLLALLPLGVLYVLSSMAYPIIRYVIRYRRKVVRRNLEIAFGASGGYDIPKIERAFYRHFCDVVVETIKLLHISDKEIDKRVEVRNSKLIEEIFRSGHSVVLYLGHHCNWEWVQAIHSYLPSDMVSGQIYRPLRNKVADKVMLRIRARFHMVSIPQRKAIRELISIERSDRRFIIGFIADQRPVGANNQKHWTALFGRETPYTVGGEVIGEHVDAAYVFLRAEQTSRGHYRLTFEPIQPPADDKEPFPNTRCFLRMLEDCIRSQPAYWLWSHSRWKVSRQSDERPVR